MASLIQARHLARELLEAESPKDFLRRKNVGLHRANFDRGPGFYLEVRPSFEPRNDAPGPVFSGGDLGEGPWNNPEEAIHFYDAEVGVVCRVVRANAIGSIEPWTDWLPQQESLAASLAKRQLEAEGESPKDFLRRRQIKRRADAKDYGDYRNDRAARAEHWDAWEELEEWQRVAAKEMEADTDLVFSLEDYDTIHMELKSKRGREFLVFQSDNEAETFTINRVREDLVNEPEIFNQDWLEHYINIDRLRDTLKGDEENMFREQWQDEHPDPESRRDELIELGVLDRDDFYNEDDEELPLTDDLIHKIDAAIDTHIENSVNDRLEDPIEYLRDIYGDETMKRAMKWGGINYDEAARDAVRTDGTAHFLARYDGHEINLPSGAVAYRTN